MNNEYNHNTPQEASNRALHLLSEGRITRGSWRGKTTDGRETLCAYLALRNGDGEDSTDNCPAWLCPQWVAELIPGIDDRTSLENQPAILERLFTQVARWGELTSEAWERVRIEFLIGTIREAMSHVTVDNWGVKDACEGVIRALKGDGDLEVAREKVNTAARVSAYAAYAADAAAYAAYAARVSAYAARVSACAACAADAAACAADAAAAYAACAAYAAYAAAAYAAYAAYAACAADAAACAAARAWDRMSNMLLDLIDGELNR